MNRPKRDRAPALHLGRIVSGLGPIVLRAGIHKKGRSALLLEGREIKAVSVLACVLIINTSPLEWIRSGLETGKH